MEAFLPESVKIVLLGVFAAGIVLVWVSRRLPQVAWLEPFRLRGFQLTEAQKARHRRFHIIKAGLEIMLAGIAVPVLYVLSKVFMFDEPTSMGMLVSGAIAATCIVIGVVVMIRSR
jgi:hypothetical protein